MVSTCSENRHTLQGEFHELVALPDLIVIRIVSLSKTVRQRDDICWCEDPALTLTSWVHWVNFGIISSLVVGAVGAVGPVECVEEVVEDSWSSFVVPLRAIGLEVGCGLGIYDGCKYLACTVCALGFINTHDKRFRNRALFPKRLQMRFPGQ